MGFKNGYKRNHYIPSELLDDLCSRFIINLPPNELSNHVRVCFHIELAHWFFLDFYCESYKLRPCGLKKFAGHIFQHIPDLRKHISELDTLLDNWKKYKRGIPTYGAILLDTNLSHVLLVQSYWGKTSWGFPKGKVNEAEEPWNCAAREVLEETGFSISKLINKMEYIDATIKRQTIRLYIIPNVSRETKFKPLTRKEIKSCEWFSIDDLPSNKDIKSKVKMNVSQKCHKPFYMVTPFLKKIRQWVYERKNTKSTVCSLLKSVSSDLGFSQQLQSISTEHEDQNFPSQELQDAFRKFQQKNFSTQELQDDFTHYQIQAFPTQELQIAYMKYIKQIQPSQKLLNIVTKTPHQNLSFGIYQDDQFCVVQNSTTTLYNSYIWSPNTHQKIPSNLDKYYQQDLPTQQLKIALMIKEEQDILYFGDQESQLYQEHYSPNTDCCCKNTNENNLSRNEWSKLTSGKCLMKPSDFTIPNPVQNLYNFEAPSWADFKFDKKAILDSMT